MASKKRKLGSYPFFTVLITITVSLFVVGLFGTVAVFTSKISDALRQNLQIQIFLDANVSESQKILLEKKLSGSAFIELKNNQPQLQFISKEEAAKKFIDQTGEDFTELLGDNPLPDAYLVHINKAHANVEAMKKIKAELEKTEGVREVDYVESVVRAINRNLSRLSIGLIVLSSILLTIVVVLINNTLKLALFSQRLLIRSMQLVGARRRFIISPFLRRAFWQGLLAGVLAAGSLLLFLQQTQMYLPEIKELYEPQQIYIIGLLLLAGGIATSTLSAWFSINRYLKMSLDELY